MDDFRDDPFFQYPRTPYPTSEGDVAMPILYFDDSNFMALFFVDHEAARAMAAVEGFEAVRFGNGRALVGVAFYDYRLTTIGPYGEVGVAIAATVPGMPRPRLPLLSLFRPPDRNRVGFHIVDLPVTTPAACAAGREIWGYPKFVTPISFASKDGTFAGSVTDPQTGTPMVTLAGRCGPGVPAPLLDLVLYSRHHGEVLRGLAVTRGGGRLCLPGSVRLDVSSSSHRMARNLRDLGLAGATPAFVAHTHRLQLRLGAGAVLPRPATAPADTPWSGKNSAIP